MRFNLKGVSFFSFLLTIWPVHGAYIEGRETSITPNSTITSNSTTTSKSSTTSNSTTSPENAVNTYDYIVVGSGPGGGPLAARLAQAGYSVLLIDAGEDHGEDNVVKIPAFEGLATEYAPISWQFFVSHFDDLATEEKDEKFTYRMPDGQFWVGPNPPAGSEPLGIFYPRTGTLGGCSEHNALALIYPHESDWNYIATLTGDSSWSANNMRNYFIKLENNQYLAHTPAAGGHGFNGWIDTTLSDPRTLYADPTVVGTLHGAASAFGTPSNFFNSDLAIPSNLARVSGVDLNNDLPTRDTTTGLFQIPLSVNNATRARSTHRDFLFATANNKAFKLKLQLNTLVTKVIFDKSPVPRAIGVEYQTGKHLYRADPNAAAGVVTGSGSFFAKREVILSGGTFNTPQILKLSGIGSSAELKAHGIPVVHESPAVGTNMQDRYELSVLVSTDNANFTIFNGCTFLNTPDDPCFEQWANNATDHGVYGGNTVAFSYTQMSSVADSSSIDLLTNAIPGSFTGYFPGWSKLAAVDAHHLSYLILKAHSRNNAGTVTLTSSDPRDVPQMHFRSYTVGADEDLQASYEGVQLVRKMIAAAEPFVGKITEEQPGPDVQTEAEVKQWIRGHAWGHHASCSVPIGPANDLINSVLDSKFRVKGVNGLRVVDASVFPKIPGTFIISAIYMISEKAADVIIQDARLGL